MADNYLVTGYWGEPHVTSEDDRRINAAAFGKGRFVLPVGNQFNAKKIGGVTVRLDDGILIDNGAVASMNRGTFHNFEIDSAATGMKRNDLIIFEYRRDFSTQIESGTFKILKGEETSGTPSDPVLKQNDLIDMLVLLDQMALWRIPVNGIDIGTPERIAPVVWNNPPLEVGVEYCTTEKWNGQPVYTQLLQISSWESGSTIDYNISPHVIRYTGCVAGWALPFINSTLDNAYSAWATFQNKDGKLRLGMLGGSGVNGFGGHIQIWYYKL